MLMTQWLLPENVEDLLPQQAQQLEQWKRLLLDLYHENGYQYIMPSMLEYVDSLNAHGKDLDLDTFKVVDQLTGKMMGVSSDLTAQAARVDAQMCHQGQNKLCYAGPILRAKSSPKQSRELYQVGIEYFGEPSIEADLEVHNTLIKSLKLLGIKEIILDFNHLDVYNLLVGQLNLTPQENAEVAEAVIIKDNVALKKTLKSQNNKDACKQLLELLNLYGDEGVLDELKKLIPKNNKIQSVIDSLIVVNNALKLLDIKVSFDFSDIRGYQYHNGLIFSAYAPSFSSLIAQGGRYDNMNEAFGEIRPATGFSMDLRLIVNTLNEIEKK